MTSTLINSTDNGMKTALNTTDGPPLSSTHHVHYILHGFSALTMLVFIVLAIIFFKKYHALVQTVRDLVGRRSVVKVTKAAARENCSIMIPSPVPLQEAAEQMPLQQQGNKTRTLSTRLPWRPLQQGPRFTKADLSLVQLIKAGKEGAFYKARMTRGTCKGHDMFTCKITKEGVSLKRVETEVAIMRKLVHHKNVLQLLDWNTSEEPYVLIMELVSYGTLRSFLQLNKDSLSLNPELQSLLTISSYHIALALEHLRSKMVVHCDVSLRNILVSRFPWEVKLAEFGLARDLACMRSRCSSRWKVPRQRVPLRWYPPEYFRNNHYSFLGDVWAFGILLWEMQTFGTTPYPSLETSEAVVYHICAGYKNSEPEGCRPEILQMMRDCWVEPYTSRPSFTDIVRILEDVIENDGDYVDVQ